MNVRRSLDTFESLDTEETPLLNALPTLSTDTEAVRVRQLTTSEALASRHAQSLPTSAKTLPVEAQLSAQEVALREKQRRRSRVIESALSGDRGPFQQFAVIFETFAIALASGIAMDEALRRAVRNASCEQQALFADVAAQIERGVPLHQALRQQEDQLPDIVVPIFEHGMIYGTAENAARQLAVALRHLARVEEKFEYSALNHGFWVPLVLGGVVLLALLPAFLALANPLLPYTLFCTACLAIGSLTWKYRYKLSRRRGRQSRRSGVALRGIGRGYVKRQLGSARWSRTFAALWNCGVPISAALEAAGRSTGNAYYERILREAAASTRRGVSLGDSLAQVGLMQGEMLAIVRTGEATGDLGPILERWADVQEDDAKERAGQVLFVWTFGQLFVFALIACILCMGILWVVVHLPLPTSD